MVEQKKQKKDKTIRLRIEDKLLSKLQEHVQENGTDMSKVIRELLDWYL